MKTYKRILAFLLTAVMVFAGIPFTSTNLQASAIDSRVESAVQTAVAIANDNSHGYSQSSRWGPDYDCSSLVYYAFSSAGFSFNTTWFRTWEMDSALKNAGFIEVTGINLSTSSGLLRGDILWKDGHTEIYIGNNQLVGAHSDYGYSQSGDQNGKEISVTDYYYTGNSGTVWTKVYRYASPYADLGDDFYAVILNTNYWKPITYNSDDSVTLETEINEANQLWRFDRQNDGSYMITSAENGYALEMYCGDTTPGNPVVTKEYWGGNYQKWYIYPQGNGYVILSKHYEELNLCLTLSDNCKEDGTKIITTTRNNDSSQIWSIYGQDDVQLKAPVLSVSAGDNSTYTTFSWNDVYGESFYNLRIWKNEIQSGEEYSQWGVSPGCKVQLPAGTYQAYVDAVNYYECKASNTVTFTISEKTYSISYNANGGSSAPSSQTKTYGTDLVLSSTIPTKENYTFIGWNTKSDGTGVSYQPGDAYTDNADVTLYAMWELAHTHSYTSSVKTQPTCTEKGQRKYTCSCGDEYFEDIAALGHTYKGVVTKATCTSQGFTTYTCSRCGDSCIGDYTAALNHPTSTWHTVVNPTVASDGLMEKRCDKCNEVLDQLVIPKLIPDYVTGISLSDENKTVEIGESFTLTATVTPDTAKNKNKIWSSRNPEIATVKNGVVTAVKPGTTAIVAESEDGGYIAFCLVRVIGVTAVNGAVINNDDSIIYGLSCNLNSADSYLKPVVDGMSLELSTSVIGTGTLINLVDNGKVVDTYTAVIFGDVNGDGWYDGNDAFLVNLIINSMLDKDDVGEAVWTAADCNHDGEINEADYELLMSAGLLLNDVDQSKPVAELITNEAYIEYMGLIDQRVEITTDTETNDTTVDDTVGNGLDRSENESDFEIIIADIIAFVKQIFSFIMSLIFN